VKVSAVGFSSAIRTVKTARTNYWPLFKSLQTILLLCTGLAGYLSYHRGRIDVPVVITLAVSLFLAISGSTVFNMWYDRDIDTLMQRTCNRPLAAQRITPRRSFILAAVLSSLGIALAMTLDPSYGVLVFAGWFCNVFVYTLWLKRRTSWSILWGGISGGMPVLAGRVLAAGHIDMIGVTLMLAILFWIPTHILTLSMRYTEDYEAAGIPTMVLTYGFQFTRSMIAISSVLAAIAMGLSAYWVGTTAGALHLLIVLGVGMLVLALTSVIHPSSKLNFGLFKYASLYMLGAMIIISIH
jgi:heme o synthase